MSRKRRERQRSRAMENRLIGLNQPNGQVSNEPEVMPIWTGDKWDHATILCPPDNNAILNVLKQMGEHGWENTAFHTVQQAGGVQMINGQVVQGPGTPAALLIFKRIKQ